MQVYIADDNSEFVEFCVKVAKQEGWTPVLCQDGVELLRDLKRGNELALVLCDLNMPNLNGIEVAYELPEIKRKLRIRFVTGGLESLANAARMLCEARGLSVGEDLIKPISVSTLRDVFQVEREAIGKFDS
jgi:CheY-like chemotaxis protein